MTESAKPRLFLCFEPDVQVCAERMTDWLITNSDFVAYGQRLDLACDASNADAFRDRISSQIHDADVLICLINSMYPNLWVLWELGVAREAGKGLVGILLKDYLDPPEIMRGCGAVFIPFKKDQLEQAILFAASGDRDLTEDYMLTEE